MATQFVTCVRCSAQNSGLSTTCLNCGAFLPVAPMPMQHMPQPSYGIQEFPGKLQAVSIIQIVAGCLEILLALFWGAYTLILGWSRWVLVSCLYPFRSYCLPSGSSHLSPVSRA